MSGGQSQLFPVWRSLYFNITKTKTDDNDDDHKKSFHPFSEKYTFSCFWLLLYNFAFALRRLMLLVSIKTQERHALMFFQWSEINVNVLHSMSNVSNVATDLIKVSSKVPRSRLSSCLTSLRPVAATSSTAHPARPPRMRITSFSWPETTNVNFTFQLILIFVMKNDVYKVKSSISFACLIY